MQLHDPDHEARTFLGEVGQHVWVATSDMMSHPHLIQRVAVATQEGNTAAVLGTASND